MAVTQAQFERDLQGALNVAGFELNKKDVQEILEAIGDLVEKHLVVEVKAADKAHRVNKKAKSDERVPNPAVTVRGVGKFTVRYYPARKGRNPQTGESITIKASKKLRVMAPKPMRDGLGVK